MWTRKELKEKAVPTFKANYWLSVLAGAIIAALTGSGGSSSRNATSQAKESLGSGDTNVMLLVLAVLAAIAFAVITLTLIKIFVGNTLVVGCQKLFINNEVSSEKPDISTIVFAFKDGHWLNTVLVMFLKDLFVSLWSLLFVIPGIIKSYEYRMIPYLLAENPGMDRTEAFAKSKEMMNGEKWNAFVLDLSFIGWVILSIFTLGILAIFYVNPYIYQTDAELYLTLKKKLAQ